MRIRFVIIIFSLCLITGSVVNSRTLTVMRGNDLQSIIDLAQDGDTLILGAKSFDAKPTDFIEDLCGNCLDPQTKVESSYGFIIKNKSLAIIGVNRSQTKLITNAGYGVYFENSIGSIVKNLSITGGIRNNDGNATDAGIVVRNSRVIIEDVNIIDNDNRSPDRSVVVGIGGVFGREGADITLRNCHIINNGWDGVALYRGATAIITDCVIQDGRGAGIGITWDASCFIYRNEISGYWKGIGAFGTSWVVARNNLVHENLGWGMIATGHSYMDITNNVIHHNGNCGLAPWSTDCRGRIANNIITENGWREEWVCPCVGVMNYGDWAKWDFSNNIVWNNKVGNYQGMWDQTDFNGNLSVDPLINIDNQFKLLPDSPGWYNGDSTIYNIDGSRSHIGLYGGAQAKK